MTLGSVPDFALKLEYMLLPDYKFQFAMWIG